MDKKAWNYKMITGDHLGSLRQFDDQSIDAIITDPKINLVGSRSDKPAFDNNMAYSFIEMKRILKPGSPCVSFFSFNDAEKYKDVFLSAGLTPVGHIVFPFTDSKDGNSILNQNRMAYVLSNGKPAIDRKNLSKTIPWDISELKDFKNQKPISAIKEIVNSYTKEGDCVLDPYARQGCIGVGALFANRKFIGIESDEKLAQIAEKRLESVEQKKLEIAEKKKVQDVQKRKGEVSKIRSSQKQQEINLENIPVI